MRFGISNVKLSNLLKPLSVLLLIFVSLILVGCETPEEKYDRKLGQCIEMRLENSEKGVICLQNLLAEFPDKPYIYYFLAGKYKEQNQLSAAEESIEIFLEYYPKEAEGYAQKCEILRLRAEYEEALRACNEAGILDPDEMSYRVSRASVIEESGNIPLAEFSYKQVIEIDPGNNSALLALGRLYEKQGRLREAIETYEKLLDVTDDKYKDKLRTQIEEAKAKRKIQQKTWKENIEKSTKKTSETIAN